jgi:hypothetical protein
MHAPSPRAARRPQSAAAAAALLATAVLCAAPARAAHAQAVAAQAVAVQAVALVPRAAAAAAAPDRTVVPDTVSAARLAHGVPLTVRVLRADGSPAAAARVTWHVVRGDVAFTAAGGHTDADGYTTATLGRAPWLRGRPGRVVVEARTGGAAADPARRVALEVVRQ